MITSSDEQALGVFDTKILRKIYGRFCDIVEWRIQWKRYDINDDIDVVKPIKIKRYLWLRGAVQVVSEIGAKLQQLVIYSVAY